MSTFISVWCVLRERRGTLGGYPIPQYLKKNWQIWKYRVENRRNTDITFMIGHAYFKLYSSPMFISNIYKPELNLSHREKTWEDLKLICPTIEKPGYWISCQFYHRQEPIKWCHRLMVRKRAYAHVKIKQQWKSTFRQVDRRAQMKDVLLPSTVSQRDNEKPHNAELDRWYRNTAHQWIKTTNAWKKGQYGNTVNPCPP